MLSRTVPCLNMLALLGSQAQGQSIRVSNNSSPAEMLAFFDLQAPIIPANIVAVYRSALGRVVRKCQEPEATVATYASNGVDLVTRESAVEVTHLAFLRAMDEAMPGTRASTGVNCTEVATSLVLMIGQD